jgi:hypothetical protein
MDVHAPHEPVHTWKDFAIHLAIVTIGLFIALMLEAGVEYWHHRHVVAEARANIRTELENNHAAAQKDIGYLSQNLKNVAANIRTLRDMETSPKGHHSLGNTMSFATLDDAAWRTARDTGALAYMPYNEVQLYSGIYAEQQAVNLKALTTADREFLALTPIVVADGPEKVRPAGYDAMLQENGASLIELCTLKQYVQQLDGQYIDALKLKVAPPKMTDCKDFRE